MPYCPECGKEVTENTDFCPHCGAKLRETEVTYRRPRGELPVVQIAALFFGGIIVIAGLGILMGGTAVTFVHREFSGADGGKPARYMACHGWSTGSTPEAKRVPGTLALTVTISA